MYMYIIITVIINILEVHVLTIKALFKILNKECYMHVKLMYIFLCVLFMSHT